MKNVIFLDIDGVLQPLGSNERFKHDTNSLRQRLAQELNETLATIHPIDIGATYFDWRKTSVEYLRKLCLDFDAAIIISSNWRYYHTFEQLLALFHIHQLHGFVKDMVGDIEGKRTLEIKDWLERHPETEKFVVLDDINFLGMAEQFGERFIWCKDHFSENDFLKACTVFQA